MYCMYSDFQFGTDKSNRISVHPAVRDFLDQTVWKETKQYPQARQVAADILNAQKNQHPTIENYMAAVNSEFSKWLEEIEKLKSAEQNILSEEIDPSSCIVGADGNVYRIGERIRVRDGEKWYDAQITEIPRATDNQEPLGIDVEIDNVNSETKPAKRFILKNWIGKYAVKN